MIAFLLYGIVRYSFVRYDTVFYGAVPYDIAIKASFIKTLFRVLASIDYSCQKGFLPFFYGFIFYNRHI